MNVSVLVKHYSSKNLLSNHGNICPFSVAVARAPKLLWLGALS